MYPYMESCAGYDGIHTSLIGATIYGKIDTVRNLLAHGADTNESNHNGDTPLHLAARSCHNEITKVLLDHGADIKITNNTGGTALHSAADSGKIDNIRTLLAYGADPNATNKYGNTALMLCKGSDECFRTLIAYGADPNKVNHNGSTALHSMHFNNGTKIIETLLTNGANINATNRDGKTLLQLAEQVNNTKVVEFLTNYIPRPCQPKPLKALGYICIRKRLIENDMNLHKVLTDEKNHLGLPNLLRTYLYNPLTI